MPSVTGHDETTIGRAARYTLASERTRSCSQRGSDRIDAEPRARRTRRRQFDDEQQIGGLPLAFKVTSSTSNLYVVTVHTSQQVTRPDGKVERSRRTHAEKCYRLPEGLSWTTPSLRREAPGVGGLLPPPSPPRRPGRPGPVQSSFLGCGETVAGGAPQQRSHRLCHPRR